jgi:hypothetical protein
MADDTTKPPGQPSLTALVTGIVSDFQELLKQQLRLTRQEVTADLRRAKDASGMLVVGALVAFVAAIPLVLGLALLLHDLSLPRDAPQRDAAALPLWGAMLLVGAVVGAVGALLALRGKAKLDAVHPLEETARALKENLEWQTNPK